jgi:predicted alpha/beta superfamily hydrolase
MRLFGLVVLALSMWSASSRAASAPASDGGEAISAKTDAQAQLFASLEGEACQGAMVLTKASLKDDAPVSIPVGLTWFRRADQSAWVDLKYGARATVARPAHITPTGLTFYGAFGQPFFLAGNAEELAGSTYTEDSAGAIRVRCVKDPAAAEATHAPPVNPVQQFDLVSKLNDQTYRLMIRVPVEPAPAGGYSALYVLDGNWYFGTVSDEAQRLIAQRIAKPFIVVAVGYPTDDRGEQNGRRDFDLTLPVPVLSGRYGGVDAFLRVLDEEIRPFIATRVQVNQAEQALYGHSFGALTALRELFRRPDAFACYALSSPSIWWADQGVLADEAAFSHLVREGKVHSKILITSAGDEQRMDVLGGDREADLHRMVDNASDLASRLAALNPEQMPVQRVVFEGEVHATVPQAATSRAVRFCFPPK